MSERKPVVWFADDPELNTFFFRSPFRSPKFAINTVLLIAVIMGVGATAWEYSKDIHRYPWWILLVLLFFVINPYWRALIRHRQIRELYLSGNISDQRTGSALDDLLKLADDSMNDGLLNSLTIFGLFLLSVLLGTASHMK
jgi:hypothetical protein